MRPQSISNSESTALNLFYCYIKPGMYLRTLKSFPSACFHPCLWSLIYLKTKISVSAKITTYPIKKSLKHCEAVKLHFHRNQFSKISFLLRLEFYLGVQLLPVIPSKIHATIKNNPLTPPKGPLWLSLQLHKVHNGNVKWTHCIPHFHILPRRKKFN